MSGAQGLRVVGIGATGAVNRDTVIQVLTAVLSCTKDVSFAVDGTNITIILSGLPEVTVLPDPVPRKMLQRFAHKYGIKIEFFYHPGLCVGNTSKPC